MKAEPLYEKLAKDFIKEDMKDDWQYEISPLKNFVTESYKETYMGLVCDFASEIGKVYTAVFPSNKVFKKILDDNIQNAMLLCHHPAVWDINLAPNVFHPMDRNYLDKLRKRNISIYNLHVPLDDYHRYGTSVTLARALGLKPKDSFGYYLGASAGTLAETRLSLKQLKSKFQQAVGHEVSLYNYGDEINGVGVIGGGGNQIDLLQEMKANTLITGITAINSHSEKAHAFAEENGINLLGGTHYSTEKFAMIAMVDYFKKLNLKAEFVEDDPVMEDL